jgi:hypothetical protein
MPLNAYPYPQPPTPPPRATASKDTKLLVWATDPQAPHVLAESCRILSKPMLSTDEHRSCVDSVAWDPLGGLLTSYAQDGELLMWTTDGFDAAASANDDDGPSRRRLTQGGATSRGRGGPTLELQAELNAPFDGGRAIPALRMDWCPDGSVLAACNAKAGGQFTAALLPRAFPLTVTDHIAGHRTAVAVARYFPAVLTQAPLLEAPAPSLDDEPTEIGSAVRKRRRDSGADQPKPTAACCTALALASLDRRITVWTSANREMPVLELSGAFGAPVTDLAWGCSVLPRRDDSDVSRSRSGCVGAVPFLLACSLDGSVAAVLFTDPSPEPVAEGDQAKRGRPALGFVAPADLAIACVSRTHGMDVSDVISAPPAGSHAVSSSPGTSSSGATATGLREWLRMQHVWTGDAVSHKLRRAQRHDSDSGSQVSAGRLPTILVQAASMAGPAPLGGSTGQANDDATLLPEVGAASAITSGVAVDNVPEETVSTQPRAVKPPAIAMAALLTQQVEPTAPEVNASAAAVELVQKEGIKRNKRRIAPVLVSELPEAAHHSAPHLFSSTGAAAAGAVSTAASAESAMARAALGSSEEAWGIAWAAAPHPASSEQVAGAVAATDLSRVKLRSWISSAVVQRRMRGKDGTADHISATPY